MMGLILYAFINLVNAIILFDVGNGNSRHQF
jgi:hypothetical protein